MLRKHGVHGNFSRAACSAKSQFNMGNVWNSSDSGNNADKWKFHSWRNLEVTEGRELFAIIRCRIVSFQFAVQSIKIKIQNYNFACFFSYGRETCLSHWGRNRGWGFTNSCSTKNLQFYCYVFSLLGSYMFLLNCHLQGAYTYFAKSNRKREKIA